MSHTYIHSDNHAAVNVLVEEVSVGIAVVESNLVFRVAPLPIKIAPVISNLVFQVNAAEDINIQYEGANVQYVTRTIINEVEEVPYTKEVDQITDTLMYIGEADPGSATSAPTWRIRKIQIITDGNGYDDIVINWADGTGSPVKIWDNRLSYPYS